MGATIQNFSYDPVKDRDIAEIVSRLTDKKFNVSAYIREAIRFYEKYKNKEVFPNDELLLRLKAIEERIIHGIPVVGPDEIITPDDTSFLNDLMGQIEGGEFG